MQIALDASLIRQERQASAISELDDIDALVRTYHARILRYVTFSIGDPDLAQTITQDCFLKAFKGRASFRGDCAISTWLISIANNLVRDQLRAKKFQFWRKANATSLDVSELASFLPSGQSSPEARLLAVERSKQVKEALEDLSAKQKQIFLLKFFEEMTLEEIADSTGMPINTVKTHLYRAVTAIRAQLGGSR